MKITPAGVLEIAEHEGLVLGPYKDSTGVWTYGVGHTSGAGDPLPRDMRREDTRRWSEDRVRQEVMRALTIFDDDLDRFERRVNETIRVPLKPHQFDALVSFDFNTGAMTWRSRSGNPANLIREINGGDISGDGFMGWTKPPKIIPRRKAEQALFRTGDYSANGDMIPLYDAHGDGTFSRRGSISGAELEGMMAGSRHPVTRPTPAAPKGLLARIIAAIMAIFGKGRS